MKTIICGLTALFSAMSFAACNQSDPISGSDPRAKITIGTLLEEMVDRDAVARYPIPEYKQASFSSYDRTSVSKDQNWFANGDNNWFLRRETNSGREEYVLFDADGPGVITRWWMTFAGTGGGEGGLRIYIDNAEEPVISGTPFRLVSGDKITVSPLASSISVLTPREQRGHNLFYPIPYSKHCKITYCSQNITPDGDRHVLGGECIYYNIEYRTYAPGTEVESFSQENATKYEKQENAAVMALRAPAGKAVSSKEDLNRELKPGESFEVKFKGPAAIREIAMQLEAQDINQALRSTVLDISFDGESTVYIPVGEFFGVGYKPMYTKTWYVESSAGGEMVSRWVMPFMKESVLRLTNHSNQTVKLKNAYVSKSDWVFDDRSMYFHAMWKLYPGLDTRINPVTGAGSEHYDLNFVTLEGKGVYMGDSMSIFDINSGWWGEGDEKVYIDGESFPSIFGTGTEDYYGYAWCHPNTIVDHPFTSQPSGTGNLSPGYTFNSRLRSLDRIQFGNKLVFDMEIWHWNHSTMDLGVSNYFYMLPRGKVLNERDETGYLNKPILSPLDLVEMKEDKIDLEAEYMKLDKISGGNYETQTAFGEKWSNGAQVFWSEAPVGSELTLSFESPYAGSYNLSMLYAFSWDYGCFDIWFNDRKLESGRDMYDANLHTAWSSYGAVNVVKGKNTIKVVAISPHSGLPDCFFGLDRIVLEK